MLLAARAERTDAVRKVSAVARSLCHTGRQDTSSEVRRGAVDDIVAVNGGCLVIIIISGVISHFGEMNVQRVWRSRFPSNVNVLGRVGHGHGLQDLSGARHAKDVLASLVGGVNANTEAIADGRILRNSSDCVGVRGTLGDVHVDGPSGRGGIGVIGGSALLSSAVAGSKGSRFCVASIITDYPVVGGEGALIHS